MATCESKQLCNIIATVPTGLEKGAADECRDVLGRVDVEPQRGKIVIPLCALQELDKVDKLRSIENYSVFVKEITDFCKDESSVLERLLQLPSSGIVDWDTPLSVWKHYHDVVWGKHRHGISVKQVSGGVSLVGLTITEETGKLKQDSSEFAPDGGQNKSLLLATNPSPDDSDSQPELSSENTLADTLRTFRVTCVRRGRQHSFSSMDAAGKLGAGLAKHFGWKAQMKNSDIEVLLNISRDSIVICLALNRESKSNRNITHFGPTTLRSAIAYGLLRLAEIQPGDVVVDPMCGGGSICIEGSLAWPSTYHLSGDNHELAAPRAMANVRELNKNPTGKGLNIDILQWDVRNLPLRTSSIDVMVTDLPFGKKSGRRVDNWELYAAALSELGRVCRPSTSRAVLLTHDNKALSRALLSTDLWKRYLTRWINIGGLTAAVYILHRTSNVHYSSGLYETIIF